MMRNTLSVCLATFALSLGIVPHARGDVKLPAVLSDHMVLQQELPALVWGTADAGEQVTVTFGEQKVTTKADDSGKWAAKLQPLKASSQPPRPAIPPNNTITLPN